MPEIYTREPVAYLLTWTCYGTWLHGDDRGSVDRDHNGYREDFLAGDPVRHRRSQNRARSDAVSLSSCERPIVARAIHQHAAFKGWDIHAINVRSNHVHLVITAPDAPPERVLVQMKAWATRALRQQRGSRRAPSRVWTNHGSTRYIWNEKSLLRAVEYVINGQDGRF